MYETLMSYLLNFVRGIAYSPLNRIQWDLLSFGGYRWRATCDCSKYLNFRGTELYASKSSTEYVFGIALYIYAECNTQNRSISRLPFYGKIKLSVTWFWVNFTPCIYIVAIFVPKIGNKPTSKKCVFIYLTSPSILDF